MDLRALEALLTSLKITKAWPFILKFRATKMSKIWPNCEKMAYSDFFNSAETRKFIKERMKDVYLKRSLDSDEKFTIFLYLFIQVVDVDCMVEPHLRSGHLLTWEWRVYIQIVLFGEALVS